MTITLRAILDASPRDAKTLLLADGLGASLTVALLAGVLARFEASFGMPRTVVNYLSLTAATFALYSLGCYFFAVGNWRQYLRAIAIANLTYCCITVGLVFLYYQQLTILGLIYFLLELLVMSILITIELLAVSNRIDRQH